MESDPHVLVALAAAVIGKAVPTQPTPPTVLRFTDEHVYSHRTLPDLVTLAVGGIQKPLPDEQRIPTAHSVINNHDYNRDTTAVLDAVATICVSNTNDQDVAVALEMDVSKQVAVLTIGLRCSGGPDLIAYLHGQWRLMCIISNQCAKLRRGVNLGPVSAPIEAPEPWRTEFVKRIYRYCSMKNSHHMSNQWNLLRGFVDLFRGRVTTLSGDPFLKSQFKNILYSLDATRLLYRSGCMTDKEWGDLICLLDATVIDIDNLFKTPVVETWAEELRNPYGLPYPLRRVLGEMINDYRQICVLLRFAQCPRSRPPLLCKLTIRIIPFQKPGSIALPNSLLCWQSLIESACGENLINTYSWLSQEVTRIHTKYHQQNRTYIGTVHSLCSLIAYLETAPRNSQPPFSYIGVSTPICAACHTWIQAFHSEGGRQYRTRGSNGEWSFPWAMVELPLAQQQAKVASQLVRLVAADCARFWTSKGHLYPASENPKAAGNRADSAPTQGSAERRMALLQPAIDQGYYLYR